METEMEMVGADVAADPGRAIAERMEAMPWEQLQRSALPVVEQELDAWVSRTMRLTGPEAEATVREGETARAVAAAKGLVGIGNRIARAVCRLKGGLGERMEVRPRGRPKKSPRVGDFPDGPGRSSATTWRWRQIGLALVHVDDVMRAADEEGRIFGETELIEAGRRARGENPTPRPRRTEPEAPAEPETPAAPGQVWQRDLSEQWTPPPDSPDAVPSPEEMDRKMREILDAEAAADAGPVATPAAKPKRAPEGPQVAARREEARLRQTVSKLTRSLLDAVRQCEEAGIAPTVGDLGDDRWRALREGVEGWETNGCWTIRRRW